MENKKKETNKPEKSRSGGFPTLNLLDAIEIIKKGSSGGWSMSKDTFAKSIGGTTANSGAFLLKLATLRDFGLIERGGKVEYTQLAREIVAPTTEDAVELQQRIKETFFKSGVFKMLYEKIKEGTGESSSATIANLGIHDFSISVIKKEVFAQNFISSAKFAGLIEESGDGKIKIIKEEVSVPKNNINDFGFLNFSPQKREDSKSYTLNDGGTGWVLNIKTDKPLNSKVRQKLIEISELLESNDQK